MRMLLDLLHASHCRGTHHKLAIDALRHLQSPRRERWTRLFLKHYEPLLRGAKDPDTKFRDFRNHVLHVRDNYWGGAITATELWYHEVVESLRARDFHGAVYAAGVLSHYTTDPIMPFHTAQSQAETNIHRAAEWSVTTTYDELTRAANARYAPPRIELADDSGWLAEQVIAGAELANQYYETLIEHYDFALGRRNPKAGWDATARDILGQLLAYAAVSYARILDRAFDEAEVEPPQVELTLATVFATMQVPMKFVARKLDDHRQRQWIEAMYEEWQLTGRVDETLADDDRAVRDLYAKEVLAAGQNFAPLAAERANALQRAQATVGSKPSRADFQRSRAQAGRTRTASDEPATIARLDEAHEKPKQSVPRGPGILSRSAVSIGAISGKVREKLRREPAEREEQPASEPPEPTTSRIAPTDTHDIDRELARIEREMDSTRDEMQKDRLARKLDDEPVDEPEAKDREDDPSAASAENDRFYLELSDPVEDAPSIGNKTARRLKAVGIQTVEDLLAIDDVATVAAQLKQRWITEITLADWQDQAALAVRIPNLRGHDAQILVACGFRLPEEIASCKPADILKVTIPYCDTSDGKRIIRSGKAPDKHEVRDWIDWAGRARER